MLYVYLACLVIGGILLAASLMSSLFQSDADADVDGDADVDVDADADADADVDADADADHDHGDHGAGDVGGVWLPFLSLRFWVFGLTFFGLCGTLLTVLQTGAAITPIVAVVVGLGCGTAAAYVIHKLGAVGSLGKVAGSNEFVGVVGKVLVGVKPGTTGKVRVSVDGQEVDVAATTTDEELPAGSRALVVEYTDGIATVAPAVLSQKSGEGGDAV